MTNIPLTSIQAGSNQSIAHFSTVHFNTFLRPHVHGMFFSYGKHLYFVEDHTQSFPIHFLCSVSPQFYSALECRLCTQSVLIFFSYPGYINKASEIEEKNAIWCLFRHSIYNQTTINSVMRWLSSASCNESNDCRFIFSPTSVLLLILLNKIFLVLKWQNYFVQLSSSFCACYILCPFYYVNLIILKLVGVRERV